MKPKKKLVNSEHKETPLHLELTEDTNLSGFYDV